MRTLVFPLLILLTILSGCDTDKQDIATPQKAESAVAATVVRLETRQLLKDPIEPVLFEYPAEALTVWRKFRSEKPVLVFLSRDPFLQPVPTEILAQAQALIQQAPTELINSRATRPTNNPLLLPSMAVSAALESGLFSQLDWVMPFQQSPEQLEVEIFRQQLLDYGAVNEQEAQTLVQGNGRFTGTIRNTPFEALPLAVFTDPQQPIILHIDLSYFSPLYKGEIKTPLFPLLYQTLNNLKQAGVQVLAVTLSSSTANGDLPLDSRFIGPILTELIQKPELLDQPLPAAWFQRRNALYLPSFMKTDETRDIYLKLETQLPSDPSIKFGLYQVNRQLKQGAEALGYLKQAVELDPVYGVEYLTLASTALEKGRTDDAVRMFQQGAATVPTNPFIHLQLAQLLLKVGRNQEALDIISELRNLEWSPLYYPGIPDLLANLAAAETSSSTK
jgi:tetratricopeptide (TPR) repeat protein